MAGGRADATGAGPPRAARQVGRARRHVLSGKVFAAPTYLFVVSMLAMIAYGLAGTMLGFVTAAPYTAHAPGLEGVGLLLLLRAFASGCTALTGVEAVSDGLPAFKAPEAHNARIVMMWLGIVSITLFLGITYLAYTIGIVPREDRLVFSNGILILSGFAILVGDLHRGVVHAVQYAQTLSPAAKAVFVETDPERTRRLEAKWGRSQMGIPLVVLSSPYRSLAEAVAGLC